MTPSSLPRRDALCRLGLLAIPALLPVTAHAHGDSHGAATPAPDARQTPWGIAAPAARARRTVEIRMLDSMRFVPDHLEVREGETLRLRIANRGKMLHELVLGTPQALQDHAELMRQHPGMEHDEPHMAHVAAGRRGELVWTFNRPGDFAFACLIPGHYEAGMRGTLRVTPQL